MLDTIPGKEELAAFVGDSLYDVWNRLCALVDETYGGKAVKPGPMNINTAGVAKHCAPYMQERTAWVSWLS